MKLDFNCRKCKYDLTSLDMTGVCPECGTAVASTMSRRSFIAAQPDVLRRIRLGLLFTYYSALAYILFVFITACLGGALTSMSQGEPSAADAIIPILGVIVFISTVALYLTGVFMTTTPAGAESAREKSAALWARIATVALPIVLIAFTVLMVTVIIDEFGDRDLGMTFGPPLIWVASAFVLTTAVVSTWMFTRVTQSHLERAHQWKHARRTKSTRIVILVLAALPLLLSILFNVGFLMIGAFVVAFCILANASTAGITAKAVKLVLLAQPTLGDLELPDYVEPGSAAA